MLTELKLGGRKKEGEGGGKEGEGGGEERGERERDLIDLI